jgi:selenocysteine lyase/cysteine desulfurase
MELSEAQRLWDPEPGWLNTASYGLPPKPAWDALQQALADWHVGATSWEPWGESTERARGAFARLIGVPATDVFAGSTVSAAISVVAAAIPKGSRVLVPEVEFTSNVFPWAVAGLEVISAPVEKFTEAIDETVDVVAYSTVQSATGEVADARAIAAAAREVDALLVVDVSQALGWLPLTANGADAVIGATYKWLMSPRGATFGYLSPRLQEMSRPIQAGWYAAEDVHASYYGLPMQLARDARRFDQSPAWFSHVGAAPALELVEAIGVERIHAYDVSLANAFRRGLGLPPSDSAIVSADVPGADERFARAGVRAAVRDGRMRAAFHLYTTQADVDLALNALEGLRVRTP